MPIAIPRKFTPEDIEKAVNVVKTERPDLWERLVQRERGDLGYADFASEMSRVVRPHFPDIGTSNLALLMFDVRTVARIEAGRPV
jgi:hypothetical protein